MHFNRAILSLALLAVLGGCGDAATDADVNQEGTEKGSSDQGEDAESSASNDVSNENEDDFGVLLAQVGDVRIGSREWQVTAARKAPANGQSLSSEEKQEVLDHLVDQKLLYLAARSRGMDSDPKVQKLMVQTLMRKDVYSKVRNSDFSPDQLKSYFDENREDFVVPEKVQVRRILIKVDERRTEADALKLAGELRAQIEAAPDRFKELAQQNSEDPYRKRGGDLGFLSKDGKPGVPSEVTAKAFDMDVGGLSEAFVAGGGVNLVTVVNKRERVERTYEQMKGSVLRKVKNERYKELYDEYVESIRSKHKTTMESGVLDTVELEPKRRFSAGGGPGMNPGKPPMIQLPQKPPQGAGNK